MLERSPKLRFSRFWAMARRMDGVRRDESGATAIYVVLLTGVLAGVGALVVDLGRMVTVDTELQSAADAAALAAAKELRRTPGSIAAAKAAVEQTLQNTTTFGKAGVVATSGQSCADAAPGQACVRFLSALPASDADPIPTSLETIKDEEARFVEVVIGAQRVSGVFAGVLGAVDGFDLAGSAVAGNDKVVCAAPPLFMCNPLEPPGNADPRFKGDFSTIEGVMVQAYKQGSTWAPGNFGLVCPAGTEKQTNCGANKMLEALASKRGVCIASSGMTTSPGAQIGPMQTGLNIRMDEWDAQNKDTVNGDWRFHDDFYPALNVTQGKAPPIYGGGTACSRPTKLQSGTAAMALPRDSCFATGTCPKPNIGDGQWNRAAYFAVNHNLDVSGGAFPYPLGSKPTRYEVYRWEIESRRIVAPGQPILGGSAQTAENGRLANGGLDQCFRGVHPGDSIRYLPERKRDLSLLDDRRVLPVAVINCQATPTDSNGRFIVDDPDFLFVFLTEPVQSNPSAAIWVEVLGELDAGAMRSLTHDVVQLYRR